MLDDDTDLLLDDACMGCGAQEVQIDRFGFPWCAECVHRKTLLAWGYAHDWPALAATMEADEGYAQETWTVAITEGEFFWKNAALVSKDAYVWALLVATGAYEKEQVA